MLMTPKALSETNLTSEQETIQRILDECRTIVAISLSSNPARLKPYKLCIKVGI